jgi:protein subunit release factor B
MSQNIKGSENMQNQEQQEQASQWAEIIGQVMEKLTGANMSTTISFDDLEIDVPKAQGPGGRDLGGAKWKINGKIVWSTEGHKTAGGV